MTVRNLILQSGGLCLNLVPSLDKLRHKQIQQTLCLAISSRLTIASPHAPQYISDTHDSFTVQTLLTSWLRAAQDCGLKGLLCTSCTENAQL